MYFRGHNETVCRVLGDVNGREVSWLKFKPIKRENGVDEVRKCDDETADDIGEEIASGRIRRQDYAKLPLSVMRC